MRWCKISVQVSFGFFAMLAVSVYYGNGTAAFLAAAAIHEVGHLLALLLFDDGDLTVELSGMGIYIKRRAKNVSAAKEAIVLICGPVLGALCGFFLRESHDDFFKVSMMLSAVNSIPVRGTDGGSLLELFFFDDLDRTKRNVIAALSAVFILSVYVFAAKEQTAVVAAAVFIFWLRGMSNSKRLF